MKRIDPMLKQAVISIPLNRPKLAQPAPTTPSIYSPRHGEQKRRYLFRSGSPLKDLSFSLRNFVATKPGDDANALYARTAVEEGRFLSTTSDHNGTGPQWLQDWVDHYEMHKRGSNNPAPDFRQVTTRPKFVQPTLTTSNGLSPAPRSKGESLFHTGSPLEDLGFSLRNFTAANPVDDPNAVYARTAAREDCMPPNFVKAAKSRGEIETECRPVEGQ